MNKRFTAYVSVVLGVLLTAGCAARWSAAPAVGTSVLPAQWLAPMLPHQGQHSDLIDWWSRLGDPVLTELIVRAQTNSPSVASARANLAAARAAAAKTDALNSPQLAAVANLSRSKVDAEAPIGTTMGAGFQASWVIDLWGQSAAEMASARAREQAAEAGWHEARVLVAGEVARLYVGQRLCQAQWTVARKDRDSREAVVRSSRVSEGVGLMAPAIRALAEAGYAEAQARTQTQSEQCERQIKALVALVAVPEPALRTQLQSDWALTEMPSLVIPAVPADLLRQRPDVVRAERQLLAAAEDVGAARAALLPALQLSGQWLRNQVSRTTGRTNFNTWTIGPLSVTLPLVGRAALTGQVDAAQAAYEAATVAYAATLRQAVAEVEQALVSLDKLAQRQAATDAALSGYDQSLRATEARYRVGLASLPDLEDARRLRLNADSSAITLQQARFDTWVALYIALGGGFSLTQPAIEKPSAL